MSGKAFVFCFLFIVSQVLIGCALLPVSVQTTSNYLVNEPERSELISVFKRMLARQRDCPSSVDANVTLSYKSWFNSGAVNGFLQAMSPSYIKFVAVSPLGQPLLLLSTDGDQFHFIDVGQSKVYEGPVKAETFTRYAPKGFRSEYGYYWLIGRLLPGEVAITSVTRDPEQAGYWLELSGSSSDLRSRVLFDPERLVLLCHDLLSGKGIPLTSIRYSNHAGQGVCPLPGKISVETSEQQGTLTLVMAWNQTDQSSVEQDFEIDLPNGFQRIFVK